MRLLKPLPLPEKLLAVIVPAAKLPLPSRLTMVLAVLALVAALAALAPAATLAADCPPTVETTVAPCVPVTLPANEPEKLFAVVAVAALPLMLMFAVPVLNCVAGSVPDRLLAVLAKIAYGTGVNCWRGASVVKVVIHLRQLGQRFIQSQQIVVGQWASQFHRVHLDPLASAAVLEPLLAACVLDQNPPHRFGCRCEEMSLAVPLPVGRVLDPQPGFVNQRGGLEGLAGAFLGKLVRGQAAQFVIDQRQQFRARVRFAALDCLQHVGHVNHNPLLSMRYCCRSPECPCVLVFNGPDKTSIWLSLPKKENQAQVRSRKSLNCGRALAELGQRLVSVAIPVLSHGLKSVNT